MQPITVVRVAAVFTAVAALFAGQVWLDYAYAGVPVSWTQALCISTIDWYLWAALTPIVLAISRRVPLARQRLGVALAVHAPASLVLTAIIIPVQAVLARTLVGVAISQPHF